MSNHDPNRVLIFDRSGGEPQVLAASKAKISEAIIARVAQLLSEL